MPRVFVLIILGAISVIEAVTSITYPDKTPRFGNPRPGGFFLAIKSIDVFWLRAYNNTMTVSSVAHTEFNMTAKLTKLVKDPFTQEVIALGWAKKNQNFYTIRSSIEDAKSNPDLQTECLAAFGFDFNTLIGALEKHCNLDRKWYPEQLRKQYGLEITE